MKMVLSSSPAEQVSKDLLRLEQLVESNTLVGQTSGNDSWQPTFVELIGLLDTLLRQSEQAGRRLDFAVETGTNRKIQDITSLVRGLRQSMPTSVTNIPDPELKTRLNRYQNSGSGYFANGVLFRCDYDGEMAYFLDDQRIYLNRHIRRALEEVKTTFKRNLI